MRILLATDGSPSSEAALDWVLNGGWPEGTEVRVVSVADLTPTWAIGPQPVPPGYADSLKTALVEQAGAAAAIAVDRLEEHGALRVTSELLHGSPRRAIVADAEAWGADLIVIGSHGHNQLERFLLGSVSGAIVSHAPCSVAVIRPRSGSSL